MTKQEIISKYERKTGKKAFTVLGGKFIYQLKDGSFCIKKNPILDWQTQKEIYCIGVYAIAFFNGMVDINSINNKGKEYNIYFGKYDN